ncbi:MAG: TfuA-like protein [Geminicoccaceae bacterium]
MRAVVFLGPSLPQAEARSRLDATWLPPAAQGDIWRAAVTLRPSVIGLVDGVFRDAPAVWHKEILFALEQGIHVLGAASMGALRAAELWPFGMEGVGRIYAAFRDGRLDPADAEPFEDDDEVAVAHAPAELGWQPLSVAMVDVRCALAAAHAAGIVDAGVRDRLVAAAKALFFADRSWDAILAAVDAATRARVAAWLRAQPQSQKRADALALLDRLAAMRRQPLPPFRPSFRMARSGHWHAAIAEAAGAAPDDGDIAAAVLEELRLDPEAWRAVRRAALLDELAASGVHDLAPATLRQAAAGLRERHGLADRRSLQAWAARNDGPPDLIDRLAATEAAVGELEQGLAPRLAGRMLDRLRIDGRYEALRRRAEGKRGVAVAEAPDDGAGIALLRWYFEDRLGMAVPDDLDAWARDLGYADSHGLERAVRREFGFARAAGKGDGR